MQVSPAVAQSMAATHEGKAAPPRAVAWAAASSPVPLPAASAPSPARPAGPLPIRGAVPLAPPSASDESLQQEAAEAIARVTAALPRAGSQPVRWHVEHSGQGVAVWLGIDGSPEEVAQLLLPLLQELQRGLSQGGLRLARVVCNGRTVLDAAESPLSTISSPPDTKEAPWPSKA